MTLTEYWAGTLTDRRERDCYGSMRDAFARGETAVSVKGVEPKRASELYTAFMNDHPEHFMLPSRVEMRQSVFGLSGARGDIEMIICPLYGRKDIRDYAAAIERVKTDIARRAAGLGEYEKIKLVCDWMIENVYYEIDPVLNQDASSALVRKKAQCSGISRAVKLLCDCLDVKCAVINGSGKNEQGVTDNHAWNIVWVDGKPCHLDVTYMMGANTAKTKPYRYLYLNYSDDEMRANHGWNESSVPKCLGDGRPHGASAASAARAYSGSGATFGAGGASGAAQAPVPPIAAAAKALGVSESEIKDVIAPYELKFMFKSAVKKGKTYLCVNCNISADPARLSAMLNDAVKQAMTELKMSGSISVSQCGKLIKYSWTA